VNDAITTATWAEGMRFVHRSASGHAVVTDAPADKGGGGTAPSPMELVLHALVGCTGVDVVSILQKMRQPLTACEVRATAERAEDHPRVYTRIRVTYALRGDLDPKKVQRAVELSERTYCSVSAMLRGAVEITSEVQIDP